MLEWYKKRSVFSEWAIQINLDELAVTNIKEKKNK